jgi:hypothetical protein
MRSMSMNRVGVQGLGMCGEARRKNGLIFSGKKIVFDANIF